MGFEILPLRVVPTYEVPAILLSTTLVVQIFMRDHRITKLLQ